jgi:hypothetical protein
MSDRRYLKPKKIIAIYRATMTSEKGIDIAARYNVCPSTVTQIRRGDRHSDITNPIRSAAAVNATLVTMACGVEL